MKWNAAYLLAAATVVIGLAMVVQAFRGGGGLGSYGVLIGAFFIAGGVMRLRLFQARDRERRS